MADKNNLPQQLRDIAHGMDATSNQATLREAAADIERLWASEFTLIDDLRDEIDAGLRMGNLLHRMLEAPTTQISPSWKEEIRRSLAAPGCKTPAGCREGGCLGWCDKHKPDVATRCEGCAALRDQLRDEAENSAMARLVSDLVKRDAHRFRKLLMQHKHWLGVFKCDPDGAPSDSLSHIELKALLDAMEGPELDF